MIKGLKLHLYKKRLAEIEKRNAVGNVPVQNEFKNVLIFFDATDGIERKVIQKYGAELERSGKVVKFFAFVNTKILDTDIY